MIRGLSYGQLFFRSKDCTIDQWVLSLKAKVNESQELL